MALNAVGCLGVLTLDVVQIARHQETVDHALNGVLMIINLVTLVIYYRRRNDPVYGPLTLDIENKIHDKRAAEELGAKGLRSNG